MIFSSDANNEIQKEVQILVNNFQVNILYNFLSLHNPTTKLECFSLQLFFKDSAIFYNRPLQWAPLGAPHM